MEGSTKRETKVIFEGKHRTNSLFNRFVPDKGERKLKGDLRTLPYMTVQHNTLSPLKSGIQTVKYNSELQWLTQVVHMRARPWPQAQSWKNVAKYPAKSAAMLVHTGTVIYLSLHTCRKPTGKSSHLQAVLGTHEMPWAPVECRLGMSLPASFTHRRCGSPCLSTRPQHSQSHLFQKKWNNNARR